MAHHMALRVSKIGVFLTAAVGGWGRCALCGSRPMQSSESAAATRRLSASPKDIADMIGLAASHAAAAARFWLFT